MSTAEAIEAPPAAPLFGVGHLTITDAARSFFNPILEADATLGRFPQVWGTHAHNALLALVGRHARGDFGEEGASRAARNTLAIADAAEFRTPAHPVVSRYEFDRPGLGRGAIHVMTAWRSAAASRTLVGVAMPTAATFVFTSEDVRADPDAYPA